MSMDPVTITGLALAILPLIISAIENYEYTLRSAHVFCITQSNICQEFHMHCKAVL